MDSATRVCPAFVGFLMLLAACTPGSGSTSEPKPDQLVTGFLEANRHAAPVQLAPPTNILASCRATPWLEVRPGETERQWAYVAALDLAIEAAAIDIEPAGLHIGDTGSITEGIETSTVQILMARPWAGDARIECDGRSTDDPTIVFTAIVPLGDFSAAGHDVSEAFEMLADNVDEHGLESVDDDDLSQSSCSDPNDNCSGGMPALEE